MTVDDFLELVGTLDWDGIESARSHVDQLDDLLPEYWNLESWMQKVAFVQLVQDQAHADLRRIMIDILRAPDTNGDIVELTKAIALGFVDERYDTFMRFYKDRDLLHETVGEVLVANDLTIDAAAAGEAVGDAPANANDESPLFAALLEGDEVTALAHIDDGADVEQTRVSEQTPLWWACNHGMREVAARLVARGADVNRADRWGGTPLIQAAQEGYTALVRDLIGWGANLHAAYHDGRTAVWFAAYHGHAETVLALLDAGIGIDDTTNGSTLLGLACEQNHDAVVDALLERGSNVELMSNRDDEMMTPLMIATRRGYPRIVKRLLDAGADRDARSNGKRAIDFADGRRAEELRELLA